MKYELFTDNKLCVGDEYNNSSVHPRILLTL